MLVKFREDWEEYDDSGNSTILAKHFSYLKYSIRMPLVTQPVYAIISNADRFFYILGLNENIGDLGIYYSNFFTVIDDKIPNGWVFCKSVKNHNMVCLDEKFDEYSYFGFSEFSERKCFLEDYLNGEESSVRIMTNEFNKNYQFHFGN